MLVSMTLGLESVVIWVWLICGGLLPCLGVEMQINWQWWQHRCFMIPMLAAPMLFDSNDGSIRCHATHAHPLSTVPLQCIASPFHLIWCPGVLLECIQPAYFRLTKLFKAASFSAFSWLFYDQKPGGGPSSLCAIVIVMVVAFLQWWWWSSICTVVVMVFSLFRAMAVVVFFNMYKWLCNRQARGGSGYISHPHWEGSSSTLGGLLQGHPWLEHHHHHHH